MPDVKDYLIVRTVEYVMQSDGQFDRAEVGRQMPAVAFNGGYYPLAYARGNAAELFYIEPL